MKINMPSTPVFINFATIMDTPIPEGFKEMIRQMPGIDGEALTAALDTDPSVSIKLNRRKLGDITKAEAEKILGYTGLEPVPWCPSGFYIPERPPFTLNPLLHAGAFYVQDASSMIYEQLVSEYCSDMAPGLALDMCAAPGGKSTSMLNALHDGWTLVSNEFMPQRAGILRENLLKWGYPRIVVTNNDTARFGEAGETFDLVAVDAPCSGEGMMRKEEAARSQWSPGLIRQCAQLQRDILTNAVNSLLPGGVLIYSTCTFNRSENEDNVKWAAEQFGLDVLHHRRFMPHISRGEGLFVAVLRKEGTSAHQKNSRKILDRVLKKCRVVTDGFPPPALKGRDLVPDASAPLSLDFDANKYPSIEVELETALEYLRHNPITLPSDTPRGLAVITYRGQRLGMVKNLGTRANNLYPKEWRIRNL